ncbi:hypothetical protein [Pseudochryseolinea flava]|uniref:Uncharacterized protein n=1 Tax=Pseudochryseolinea flava TaxID=2059302 RepID=A0A364XVA7_9BACT|nr:hypothetical protein [Pseudochryseolinea flava]RAV98252.1 hypothetical protein DQQ10_24945 [Pseudochryseolinea flava]
MEQSIIGAYPPHGLQTGNGGMAADAIGHFNYNVLKCIIFVRVCIAHAIAQYQQDSDVARGWRE